MKLIYYSLANFRSDSREHQWIQSIRSLRLHNQTVPVWLLLFNGASVDLLREAERWNVHVCSLGDYGEFMHRAHPRGSVLALYPTFHKFLVLPQLPTEDVTQILYLDCDTFFFDDVGLLFDEYAEYDFYAREEFRSSRSPLGYDPNHIDEKALRSVASRESLHYVEPFNSGVCLLKSDIWKSLSGLRDAYLDFAWRLLCGREMNRHDDDAKVLPIRRAVLEAMTDLDRSRALPYPSKNEWIVEQIALWLALGRLALLHPVGRRPFSRILTTTSFNSS